MPGKTVAVVQSNYVPWRGYFDLIGAADEFILYDDAQYTKNDWRNRNRIATPSGPQWLTIPVQTTGRFGQAIKDTTVVGSAWRKKHWRTLLHSYQATPGFAAVSERIEYLYLGHDDRYLSTINRRFIDAMVEMLELGTRISWSSDYSYSGETPTASLVSLLEAAGASTYLSGPSAKSYLDEGILADHGVELFYVDYSGYPEYPQRSDQFDGNLSILDLIFNVGREAGDYLVGDRILGDATGRRG